MPLRIRAVRTSSSAVRSQKLSASTGAPYRKGFLDSTSRYYSDYCNRASSFSLTVTIG